jgi:hypothetical protein
MNANFLNQHVANRLGFAALAPFVLLSLACWTVHPDWLGSVIRGQLAYGIAILSFLGGIHWSGALLSPHLSFRQTRKALILGVVPSVVAWCAVLFETGFGFAVLLFGFIAAYQVDKRLYLWYKMPAWFLVLRLRLTVAVAVALLVTFVAANVRT